MGKIFSFKDTDKEIKEEKKNLKDLKEAVDYKIKVDRNKPVVVVQLSWELLAAILLILAFIFWGNQLITVLLFLFFGFVFTSAARPVVGWLMSRKISKGWAVALTYIVAMILVFALLSIVIFPLAGQVSGLVQALPQWVENVVSNFQGITLGSITIDSKTITDFVSNGIQNITTGDSLKGVTNAVGSVVGTTGLLISSLVLSIYLVMEHDSILDFGLVRISSDQKRNRVKKLVMDVENKLGKWLLGQATVSSIAGIFVGILLTILNVPFALPLAVMTAILDAIPGIGATIATVIIAVIALITVGPVQASIFVALVLVYQQIENNLIIPKVMGNAIGLKPVIIMLGVFIALILFGIPGAIIAVPVMVLLQIFYEFYIDLQKLKAKGIV